MVAIPVTAVVEDRMLIECFYINPGLSIYIFIYSCLCHELFTNKESLSNRFSQRTVHFLFLIEAYWMEHTEIDFSVRIEYGVVCDSSHDFTYHTCASVAIICHGDYLALHRQNEILDNRGIHCLAFDD